jgi:7-cyano-7-deazaguanine synthase
MTPFSFPNDKDRGLLIYSGGMDSTTLLYECRPMISICLSFNYGAKHNARELDVAAANCSRLGVRHEIVHLPFVSSIFRSDLLISGGPIPERDYDAPTLKRTVVPFRNGIMLSIAAGVAESLDLGFITIANHGSDHEIYPDCRPSFIESMHKAIWEGSDKKIALLAPYTHLDKRAIAVKGRELKVNFEQTWSCYKGARIHCGACGTCRERKRALAGFDPTVYSAETS